jgi:gluconolactonase
MDRRAFLQSAAVAAGSLAAMPAMAQQTQTSDPKGSMPPPRNWNDPSTAIEPDPAFESFDDRGAALNGGTASMRRIASGQFFTEGPVYFADQKRLIWSDIPADRLYSYNEITGVVSSFRHPSGHANGNSRDWQGRLLTCEHGNRRVTRTEYDGRITVVADKYQGKQLNSPNGIIAKKDGTLWFTDPPYGLVLEHQGYEREEPELPPNVYMFDPKSGELTVAAGDFNMPNGLCFSPDEKKLYITDTGILGGNGNDRPSWIRVFDVTDDNKLINGKVFHDLKQSMPGAISDDIRADMYGNIWSAGGWGPPTYNGVSIYAPDGTAIARIVLPEVAANLCFGESGHNTIYICASTSVYALNVNDRGVEL